ncbi:hypothetical protein [Sphingomonas immobilis]|uniref:Uncharacterized protein n=1 Tax=Sphingomonas immobilis TaxID=3063997 RepID=A0ABT9A0S4_9SPHN|nr:hypothetical protein [Sphingomonas sp. CA1-15]MDO7843432.1 hypothetical protein [Sphingomonas sp. CA1-15]
MITPINPDAALLDAWRSYSEILWADHDGRQATPGSKSACDVVINARANTPAGVAAQLRLALWTNAAEPWLMALALGGSVPGQREKVDRADMIDRIIWSAIEALDALEPAAGQHRTWLDERNKHLAFLNDDDNEGTDREAIYARLGILERQLVNTPAACPDDVVARLVHVAQTVIEGFEPAEGFCAQVVAEAQNFLALGSVEAASVSARQAVDPSYRREQAA